MSWKRQILAYDDAALAQLCSTGLLRRAGKQLEAGKVELHSDESGQGVFAVGAQQVTLLKAPLEQSLCDCSAGGVCVHILAAVLHTRENAEPSTTPQDEGAASVGPCEELAAYSPEAVMKWAGKPGTRLAARLLATLPSTSSEDERRVEEKPGSLEIVLDAEVQCRYILGAGLDGILCDAPESRRKGIIAACLLYWQQQQGRVVQWPDDSRPESAEGPLSEEEGALVREVQQQLKRMLDAGLMHLPQAHETALRTLAWSARGESLPRLSALLLRLAGEITAFRDRVAGTDARQLFDLLTAVWVLCERLLSTDPEQIKNLRGRFRRDYSAKSVGPLWSCGAYRYMSRSGAQGVSAILWDLESREPLRLNMGRTGEGAGAFNPYTLWQSVVAWNKGRSLESMNAQVLRLEGARVSGDGRLSLSQETFLQSVEAPCRFAEAIAELGITRWDRLSESMEAVLENEEALMPPLIIRPSEVKAFQVAEHDQRWIGWARDTDKKWLRLSAPVDDIHNERVAAINKLIDETPFGFWGLVLEPRRDRENLLLTPVAVIMKHGDEYRCFNPDLEYINLKEKKRIHSWLRQVMGSTNKAPSDEVQSVDLASITKLLNDVRQLLMGAAEIGLDCRYLRTEQVSLLVQPLRVAGANHLARTLEQLGRAQTHTELVKTYHAFELAWRKMQVMEQLQTG
jgi:hypothetical protein